MDTSQPGLFDREFFDDLDRKRNAAGAPSSNLSSLGFPSNTSPDISVELNAACAAVLSVLSDGQWHGASEIITRSGYTEAMRRLRELRTYGYDIRKRGTGRAYEYRLVRQ